MAMKEVFVTNSIEEEIKILSQVNHQNIIKGYASGRVSPSTIGILMELAEGSLYDWIHNPTKEIFAIKCAHEIADGMIYLYSKGIQHRNLQITNILVKTVRNESMKIAGFGLAKLESVSVTSTLGYHLILAPEILINPSGAFTEKCDVYSFGLILWELLTRQELTLNCFVLSKLQYPCHLAPLLQKRPEIEKFLQNVVKGARPKIPPNCEQTPAKEYVQLMEKCWHHNPDERPTFQEIKNSLSKLEDYDCPSKTSFMIPSPLHIDTSISCN